MAENDADGMLEDLRGGDSAMLAPLFHHYRDRLWRMVHFRLDPRLSGRFDADDILQEAYVDAERRLHHYMEDSSKSFFVWLRLVVGQTMVDVHRRHIGAKKRDARQEVSLGGSKRSPAATTMSLAGHLLGHLTSPSMAAMRAEVSAKLEEALETMDEIDREVLMLRHFEELSNNEVSEVLGIKKTAASNRYVRALTRLRKILEDVPGFGGGDEGEDA